MRQRKNLRVAWHRIKSLGSEELDAAVAKYEDLKKQLHQAEKDLIRVFTETETGKSLQAVLGYGDVAKIGTFGLEIGAGDPSSVRDAAGFEWVFEDEPTPYVDPKTLNALLSMKLLSDDEKRQLLIRHNIIQSPT